MHITRVFHISSVVDYKLYKTFLAVTKLGNCNIHMYYTAIALFNNSTKRNETKQETLQEMRYPNVT